MVIHGSALGFYLSLIGWLFLYRLTVASAEDLEAIFRSAVRNAMFIADLTIKDAAYRLGRNESDFRKALRGERGYYLPFVEMVLYWPFTFWLALSPQLFAVLAKKRLSEINETASEMLRRA